MKVKKILLRLLLCVFVLAVLFAVAACEPAKKDDGDKISSIAIEPASAALTVGEELNYDDFEITVTYEGKKAPEKVKLTAAMISEDDKLSLSEIGTHSLTVNCMGGTTTLQVTVNPLAMDVTVENASAVYTGEPVLPSVKGAPKDAKIEYTVYSGTSAVEANKVDEAVDAGEYFVQIKISAKNYATVEKTATISIEKAQFDVSELIWSNTGYLYTGTEIQLAATCEGMPEGISLNNFTAKDNQAVKATEKGYYEATANFTGSNKNYTLTSCVLTWRILEASAVDLEPWFGISEGTLISAVFDKDTFTFDGTTSNYETFEYDADGNAVIPVDGYISVTVKGGVLRVQKADRTYALISESALARFAGQYSMIVEEFELVFDKINGTANLVSKLKGEEAVTRPVSLQIADGDDVDGAVITVEGVDWEFRYDLAAKYLRLDKYENPADFNVIDTDGVYLATKEDADAYVQNMPVGTFVNYNNTSTITANENGEILYNEYPISVYCSMYYRSYSSDTYLEAFVSIDSNHRERNFVIDRTYFKLGSDMFIPGEYGQFFGVYYLKDNDGLHSDKKISFMEYTGNYSVVVGSVTYDYLKGQVGFELNGDVLTVTLTKEGETAFDVVFTDGITVANGDSEFLKVQSLIEYAGYAGKYYYVSVKGEKLSYDNKGAFTLGGETTGDYTILKTDNGTKLTLNFGGETCTVEWGADNRYLTVNGTDLYVYSEMASDTDGRTSSMNYVSGDDVVKFVDDTYFVNDAPLTDLSFSLVDDGNHTGRKVLQVKGKLGTVDYTILHYSQATLNVNGEVYVAEVFSGIYGSEFKPTVDSENTFKLGADGKMMFRGKEIFVNSTNTYTHFEFYQDSKLYYYSFTVNATNITFNDSIVYNVPYYFAAFFDFKGAYISSDGTKAFYFAEKTVYYDETSSTSFSVIPTESGATMKLGDRTAIFTKTAQGVISLVYNGITYNPVSFDLNDIVGDYIVYNGNSGGIKMSYNPNDTSYYAPKLSKLIVRNGEITPVINFNYGDNAYLIKNTDGATAAKLPYLAVQDKFANLIGSELFNGKILSIAVGVTTKPDSTDLMPSLVVLYDGETATLVKEDYQNFRVTLGGKEYFLRSNSDSATKDILPLLVFESWWEDYDGEYKFNGNTVKLEITVGGAEDQPATVLKTTFNGEEIEPAFEDITGGKMMTFTLDGVTYKGVMSKTGSVNVAVYKTFEYDFFYTENFTNTVEGKALSLPVVISGDFAEYVNGYAIKFDLTNAKYGEESVIYAQYLYTEGILIFETATQSYAYDIAAKQLYSDVLPEGSDFRGAVNEGEYGSVLDDVQILVRFVSFDKTSGKAVLGFYFDDSYRGTNLNLATSVRVNENLYKLTGKTAAADSVTAYLEKQADGTFVLYTESEYLFDGEFTVDGKTLVIERSIAAGVRSYTVSYDGADAVDIKPDFNANSFTLVLNGKYFSVTWTIENEAVSFALEEIPAAVMQFVKGNTYAYNTWLPSQTTTMNITFAGMSDEGALFNIECSGSISGTYQGVLSNDGLYLLAKLGSSNYRIYINPVKDFNVDYVLVYDTCGTAKFMGTHTVDGKELTILISSTSKEDDDGFAGFNAPSFVVTYDGKSCTSTTVYKDSVTSVEFTVDGKTYEAKIENNQMTVTEKTAA